jgi:hypothetical protein
VCALEDPEDLRELRPVSQEGPNAWICEVRDYLKYNLLPEDQASAERIVRMAKRYTVVEGDLYRRGANGILMRCITREEGCDLLAEIHGGECESHSSSRTLVGKAFRHGFRRPGLGGIRRVHSATRLEISSDNSDLSFMSPRATVLAFQIFSRTQVQSLSSLEKLDEKLNLNVAALVTRKNGGAD